MNMYLCYERERDLWVATCGVTVTVREKDKHRRPYRKKESTLRKQIAYVYDI
jgi:hypothetical protein